MAWASMCVYVSVCVSVHVFTQLWFPLWLRFFFTNAELRFHSNSKKHISMAGVLHVWVYACACMSVYVSDWWLSDFSKERSQSAIAAPALHPSLFPSITLFAPSSLPQRRRGCCCAAAVQMRLPKIFSLMELSGFLWLLGLQIYVQYVHKHTHTYICM